MIPTKEENPKGLHLRYHIQKYDGQGYVGRDFFQQPLYQPIYKDVDPNAEYFVLRLDKNGSDPKHIKACRKAILTYCNEIKDHLPELAADLELRYSDVDF